MPEDVPKWLTDVADLFGVGVDSLKPIANVLDDVTCWHKSDELNDIRIIRLAAPFKPGFVGYLARLPAGSKLPPQGRGGGAVLMVLRGGFYDYRTDRHLRVGDVLTRSVDDSRGGLVDPGEDCVCAVLVDLNRRGDPPRPK